MIIKIEIDVAKEIIRIADIPSNSKKECHEDHKEMTKQLKELAENIRRSRQ